MPTKHDVDIPEPLWQRIAALAAERGYGDKRGGNTSLIVEMISAAAARWEHSPYVCLSAQHTVFVTERGDVFYRLLQELKPHKERDRLPCAIEMKPEKKNYYGEQYDSTRPEGLSRGEWFRDRWIVNYFAAWRKSLDGAEEVLDARVDRKGSSSKMVHLDISRLEGGRVIREAIIGLKDYVQWREAGTPRYDRVDLDIDIPTSNLTAFVIVDDKLYKNLRADEIRRLEVEFRNLEWARFVGREVVDAVILDDEHRFYGMPGRVSSSDEDQDASDEAPQDQLRDETDSGDPEAVESAAGYSRSGRYTSKKKVREELKELICRVQALANSQVDESPVASDDGRAVIKSLEVPEHFSFYEINWPSPLFGIDVCVGWEKPTRS